MPRYEASQLAIRVRTSIMRLMIGAVYELGEKGVPLSKLGCTANGSCPALLFHFHVTIISLCRASTWQDLEQPRRQTSGHAYSGLYG